MAAQSSRPIIDELADLPLSISCSCEMSGVERPIEAPSGRRRFAPSLLGTVLTLMCVALCGRLGWWQLDRAGEKRALLAQYQAGQQSTVELTAAAGKLPRYQQVHAAGRYDSAHQILLDNMPSQQGWPGYRVVTPFELEGGGWILVDRGWVRMGATRAALPEIAVGEQPRRIAGRLDQLPRAGIQLDGKDTAAIAAWPRVMSFPTQTAIEKALGRKLLAGVVLLDPAQPDGYERVWEARFSFGPQRHIGYAVQWFALAAAALVIYLVTSLRQKRVADDKPQ